MPEFQKLVNVSFDVARVGYHEGPAREQRMYCPCTSLAEAYQRIRQEFSEEEYDIWNVVADDHLVGIADV